MTPTDAFGALGMAVVHFLWQGALIGVIAGVVLGALRNAGPASRYWVGCAALGACALVFGWTALMPLVASAPTLTQATLSAPVAPLPATQGLIGQADASPALNWPALAGWVYLGGVVCLGLRWLFQSLCAQRLGRVGVSAPDAEWERAFAEIRERLGVHAGVRLMRSAIAETPMVIGVFAPVVLVPVSVFTSLPPDQLRAVLVHELAHIRRHDPVLNALQAMIETVLFFHPVVWWLSRRIRIEREHCCDDAAAASVEPRTFAEALASLELLRSVHPQAAVAANGGSLMDRIARLTGSPRQTRSSKWRALTALAFGAVVALAGVAHTASAQAKAKDEIRERSVPDDQMLEVVRQLADTGAPEAQVRALYDTLVAPHSALEAKLADELEALKTRLARAVENGRITEEVSEEMLGEALAKHQAARDQEFMVRALGMRASEVRVEMAIRGVQRAVDAGEISPEQGDAKIAEIRVVVKQRAAHGDRMKIEVEQIKSLVEKGELTEAEARAKIQELEHRHQLDTLAKQAEQHIAKIRALVETGELSADEASAKIAEIKAEVEAKKRYMQAEIRVNHAIASGAITEEAGKERLAALRKHEGAKSDVDWDRVEARIEGAVHRGDMTREEADALYVELKARIDRGEDLARDDQRPGAWISGSIAEIGRGSFTLRTERGALEVLITDSTTVTLNGRRAQLGDLEIGDGARVQGRRTDRGFAAVQVNAVRRDGGDDDGGANWIGGSIAEIERDAVTFRTEDGSVRVLVTDGTSITINGRDAGLGDLEVGDRARAEVERTDRGVVGVQIKAYRR